MKPRKERDGMAALQDSSIPITRPHLPPIERFQEVVADVFASRMLSNFAMYTPAPRGRRCRGPRPSHAAKRIELRHRARARVAGDGMPARGGDRPELHVLLDGQHPAMERARAGLRRRGPGDLLSRSGGSPPPDHEPDGRHRGRSYVRAPGRHRVTGRAGATTD